MSIENHNTLSDNTKLLSDESIQNIKKNIIEPELIKNVTELASAPRYWRKTANVAQTISQIFVGINIILSFCASGLDLPILSIVAGIVGTIAVVLSQFSSFSEKESRESNTELNILLSKVLRVDIIPDLVITDDDKEPDLEAGKK